MNIACRDIRDGNKKRKGAFMHKQKMIVFLGIIFSIFGSQMNIKQIYAKTVSSALTCTDSGGNFYGYVTVDSYSSNSSTVCTGRVTSRDSGEEYTFEFQPDSSSSYSATAINASMQTACKVLEKAQSGGLEVIVSGDIFDCSLSSGIGISSHKIKAEYIVIGDYNSLSYTNAFYRSTEGDAVSVADCSVMEYLVYSNVAYNQCSPSLLTSDEDPPGVASSNEDFGGSITAADADSTGGKVMLSEQVRYAAAVSRCNDLLDAYLNNQTVDITGEIDRPPSSATGAVNADVQITKVE